MGKISYYYRNCQAISFLCNKEGVQEINISFHSHLDFSPMALKSLASCFSDLEKGNGGWQVDIQVTPEIISGMQ